MHAVKEKDTSKYGSEILGAFANWKSHKRTKHVCTAVILDMSRDAGSIPQATQPRIKLSHILLGLSFRPSTDNHFYSLLQD